MSEDSKKEDSEIEPSVLSEKHIALKRFIAEMFGTAILVIVGCGAAMGLSIGDKGNYIALAIGTAFAFGLVVTALSYALGEFSGCHVNPAVSFALFLDHRIGRKQFIQYVVAQVIGGIIGGAFLLLIFGAAPTKNEIVNTLASNSTNMKNLYAVWHPKAAVPVAYSAEGWPYMFISLISEVFFALVFVFTILCTSHKKDNGPVSGIALGLSLVGVILLGFNITGTGVNPARSIGTAVMCMAHGEFEPIKEIWIFILGPMIGAYLAVLAYNTIWHNQGAHIKPVKK